MQLLTNKAKVVSNKKMSHPHPCADSPFLWGLVKPYNPYGWKYATDSLSCQGKNKSKNLLDKHYSIMYAIVKSEEG